MQYSCAVIHGSVCMNKQIGLIYYRGLSVGKYSNRRTIDIVISL